MSQWGGYPQQQPQQQYPNASYQQPMQTGFQPQQTGASGFLQPLQAQRTGFQPQQQQFLQPQQTGYGGPGAGLGPGGGVPPVPPLPGQYASQPSQMGLGASLGQQRSFLSPSPALQPQQTGYPGGQQQPPQGQLRPLVPQATGYHDPRLQMMSSTFMPANMSAPYAPSGVPQFAASPGMMAPGAGVGVSGVATGLGGAGGQQSLQQSFEQHNQMQRGTTAPKVPWALSKEERKNYDQIFRAWDTTNSGFISGETALEVFGQSGLDRNDLASIWSLADGDNRGKLNIAEFHVAMGLIYRRLNGNEIPTILPPELQPPSSKNLDESVNMLKDILKHDTHDRATSGSRGPIRSFQDSSPATNARKDGANYKHDDTNVRGYTSRARRVDRDAVRSGSSTPQDDLSDIKRQLANTDKQLQASEARSAEDEALDGELEDLKYRVRRIQEDIQYLSRRPRSTAKDQEEKRKLDRELTYLMYEKVPEVERKIEERDRRKMREKEDWTRDRDRRNDPYNKYRSNSPSYSSRDRDNGRDRERDRSRRRSGDESSEEEEEDRGYLRGTFSRRDDDRERDRYDDRDRHGGRTSRNHDRDREYGRDRDRRPSPPPTTRSPAPPPPKQEPDRVAARSPAPPPAPSPAPSKPLTQADIQARARKRVEDRMRALGLTPPPVAGSAPAVDTSTEDRLATERKEAEEKAKQAEKDAEERDRARKARLESERVSREPAPAPPAPAPSAATSSSKPPAPPPPTKRAPPPKPPVRNAAPPKLTPAPAAPAPPPVPTPKAPPPVVDDEEEEDRRRFEALEAKRAARRAELARLEEEARREEEEYEAKMKALRTGRPNGNGVASPSAAVPTSPPTPPPAPPAPTSPPTAAVPRTNPFHKLTQQASGTPPVAPAPTSNPWSTPTKEDPTVSPSAPPAPAPPPPPPPPPPPVISTPAPVPAPQKNPYAAHDADDWDDPVEKDDEDDSSDDEFDGRNTRSKLASQLFGSIMRPGSTGPEAPTPPRTPKIPVIKVSSGGPVDRNALLGSIQAGARLRPTKTNDRSAVATRGAVLGDTAPPAHISAGFTASPTPKEDSSDEDEGPQDVAPQSEKSQNRQSVDWYAGLASDGLGRTASEAPSHDLPSLDERDEEEPTSLSTGIQDAAANGSDGDDLADIDLGVAHKVRTLYAYSGQGDDYLSFRDNLVIDAHPSKSGGDWWYGTLVSEGKKGLFPRSYVEVIKSVTAKAVFSYTGASEDELSFSEGDTLTIVDRSDNDWWKTDKGGVVLSVPAGYLQIDDASGVPSSIPDAEYPRRSDAAREPKDVQGSRDDVSQPSTRPLDADSGMVTVKPDTVQGGDVNVSDASSLSSFESESDSEDISDAEDNTTTDEVRRAETERREAERLRVMQAAGLIIRRGTALRPPPPPSRKTRPTRQRSTRVRRPPPAVPKDPTVLQEVSTNFNERGLPELPKTDILHEEDAFDRYESFRQSQPSSANHRLSIASADTAFLSPTTTTPPSLQLTTSRDESSETQSISGGTRYHFRHFFSRSGASASHGMERRSISNISGPIPLNSSPDPLNEKGESSFGTSWSSLVESSVLEGMPKTERRRQEAIFELISTEGAYVRDLQLVVETFYAPLLHVLSETELNGVFSNIEEILLCNTAFLSSLEDRQKESRLYITSIADILASHTPNLGIYENYCVNQGPAIQLLQSLRTSRPELEAQLSSIRNSPAARNLDLSSYLLIPMQRITRYPLLLRQIYNNTNPEDKGPIEVSIREIEVVLDRINESVRDREGREILAAISKDLWIGQGQLDLTADTRYMGPRKLLKEGILFKAKSKRRLHAFLCSDILVLTDATTRSLYRMPITLNELQISDLGTRDKLGFQLSVPYPRGGDALSLRGSSERDAQAWKRALDNARAISRAAAKGQ